MTTTVARIALAVDSGQTGIKVRTIPGATHTHTYPGVQTNRELLPQLADAVVASARASGMTFDVVAIGTSGLTEHENDPVRLLELCRDAGVSEVRLAHDSITSYLGALGLRHGVVVAAGTGVVTLGVGAAAMSRVDGWGNIMGDAGSGYWIGREALDAVMRAYDGRGPQTALTPVVQARFPKLDQAYITLQTDPDRVRVVASFARSVDSLAGSDPIAASICRRAGEELALSAVTAARNVGVDREEHPTICLVGSVFSSSAVRHSCEAAIRRSLPEYEPTTPAGDGLAGAELLLDLPEASPLFSTLAIATLR